MSRRAWMALALALLAGAAAAQDRLERARTLARTAVAGEQVLVAVRGELWKQVREAGPASRDQQHARYLCISRIAPGQLDEPLARALAERLDEAAMSELTAFYGRREIQATVERRVRSAYRDNHLPRPDEAPLDKTFDDLVGTGSAALATMRATPLHRGFETALRGAYSGPLRNLLAQQQDACAPGAAAGWTAGAWVAAPAVRGPQGPAAYPPRARQLGIEGRIEAQVEVDADGQPLRARIARRWLNTLEPSPIFDAAVLAHVLAATHPVPQAGGKGQAGLYTVPYRFELE